MKHWNKIRYQFIKDAILVILILLHEKVVKFCLIVFLINSRFSKVQGGLSPPPSLKKGGSAPKRALPPPLLQHCWDTWFSKFSGGTWIVPFFLSVFTWLLNLQNIFNVLLRSQKIKFFFHPCYREKISLKMQPDRVLQCVSLAFSVVGTRFKMHSLSSRTHSNRGGSSLICKEGCRFPWRGTRGGLTAHSPLQSATLLSQHYHYLRWSNLHVRRSVTFYL
jgi:hypothetical protein